MKVIAGKYTLVLTTFVGGCLLLLHWFFGIELTPDLWIYSPVVLVILGIEIMVLNRRYTNERNVKIEVSAGNVILIACEVAVFMIGTASIDINKPMLDNIFELSHYVRQKI